MAPDVRVHYRDGWVPDDDHHRYDVVVIDLPDENADPGASTTGSTARVLRRCSDVPAPAVSCCQAAAHVVA